MMKVLSGLVIPLVMAAAFSLFPPMRPKDPESFPSERKTAVARPSRQSGRNAGGVVSSQTIPPHSRHLGGDSGGVNPAVFPVPASDIQAMAPSRPAVSSQPSSKAGAIGRVPSLIASGTALANLALADHYPPPPATRYPNLPDKGLYVWGEAVFFSSRENGDVGGGNPIYTGGVIKYDAGGYGKYDHDGQIYRLGIKKDWSIDSIIGLSADLLDSSVKSGQPGDNRRNDILGVIANAHLDALVMEKYPLSARAFYGRARTDGSGSYQANAFPAASWREEKYDSSLYGFSLKAGLPLLFGDDIKILPEFGVEYTGVKSDAHQAWTESANQAAALDVSSRDSYSLAFPATVRVKKDYFRCWGVFTPRLDLGVALEASDSAGGVRSMNAAAATKMFIGPNGLAEGAMYGPGDWLFCNLGVGFDLRTNSGWQVRAGYGAILSRDYRNQKFELELGKCF